MTPIQPRLCAIALVLGAALSACSFGGSDSSASSSSAAAQLSGSFADFPISGLSYATQSLSGITTTSGGFSYRCANACEAVAFRLGGIYLGTLTGTQSISLKDFSGGMSDGLISDATVRKAQLVLSLDADADPTNGIELPTALATSLATRTLDFTSTSFDADLASLTDYLRADSRLTATYRAAIQTITPAVARALVEQAEGLAHGVLVESPASKSLLVSEIRKYVLRIPDIFLVPYSGASALLSSAFPRGFRPALGAGLMAVSASASSNGIVLKTVTSRGIAVSAPRYYDGSAVRSADVLLSNPTNGLPSIGTLTLSPASAELSSLIGLRAADGTPFSGRPTPIGASGSDNSRNLDETLNPQVPEFDQQGLDPAGVAEGDSGTLWICDRRGPFLVQVDSQGRTLQRIGPSGTTGSLPDVSRKLPSLLEYRQSAQGCGGVAVRSFSGEILLALGAPLDIAGRTATSARFIRVVTFNPKTAVTRQFGIPIAPNEFGFRVLDLDSLGEQKFLALVRYRDGSDTGPYRWEVRVTDLSAASDLTNRNLTSGPSYGLALEYGSAADIAASNVTLATSSTVLELGALGWISEGAEGLAHVDAQTLVVIGQVNGGVTSRVVGGNPALKVSDYQVDRYGLISPRASTSSAAPVFQLAPAPPESRQIVVWSMTLRTPLN